MSWLGIPTAVWIVLLVQFGLAALWLLAMTVLVLIPALVRSVRRRARARALEREADSRLPAHHKN